LAVRLRQIAPVALVLALTVAGFIVARLVTEREARSDSEHRAEVAAAQMGGRVAQAASLTESLGQYMLNASGTGVTSDQFARNALRWLSPAGFPAAAWVERVPDSRRAAYERRIGQPIVTPDERLEVVPTGSRSSYLPATLVSGFPPMAVPGSDLSGVPGMARALARAPRDRVAATPVAPPRTGTHGLFLVAPAPNLIAEVLRPGYVVVFVSDRTLRAAATGAPTAQIAAGGASTEDRDSEGTTSETFTAAGQRFEVAVPKESVEGAAAVLPWIILAAGLVLAALAAALGVSAARRAGAQEELDRIFTLSPDLIAVADFDGYFTRVNPAVEQVLGYTPEEFVGRPFLDFVHPEDRERTAAESAAIGKGKKTLSFENRYVRKDGSYRVLEWTSTPAVEEGLMYGVGRDVTDRRRAEVAAQGLAAEQAALRRVATLVAEGASPSAVLDAVVAEMEGLLDADQVALNRFEPGDEILVLAHRGLDVERTPVGSRVSIDGASATARVRRTGRPARMEGYEDAEGALAELARATGLHSSVSAPITVEGRQWGLITASWKGEEPPPPDTEDRMVKFARLLDTAIANTEARAEVERLADEQASLRRVATLVARGSPPTAVFDAVAAEVEALLGADGVMLSRYEPDGEVIVVANRGLWADKVPRGTRARHTGENVTSSVRRTERPARMEQPLEDSDVVGVPIVVEGRLWGCTIATWHGDTSPPADTEERMAQFAELLDTAIANADSRAQLTASRARLVTAGDEARRRVVRDLHDGAQQRLVHAIITLKLAHRALRQGSGKAESLVGEALEHAEQGNAELRELAHGILPAVLTSGGLPAGIDAVVRRLDVPVQVDVPVERLPAEIEASAYFIMAEALTNVVKHSHAGRAGVSARVEDGTLQVEVRDDGTGGADPGGHGLVGIADRVAALGGRLKIESPAGRGTVVAAALPLSAGLSLSRPAAGDAH
jgi:PAS domain S-box-containing protein